MIAKSYANLLNSGAADLRVANLDDPVREARRLLLLASGKSPADLIAHEMDIATDDHIASFRSMIEMRAQRVPFEHIAGQVSFFGLMLRSDSRALIPRADSETVVSLALDLIPEGATFQIADLGTGSGALLAAILSQRPKVRGIGIENDPNAILLAIENFEICGISRRADLFEGGWADWQGWSEYDLILSNPPYIQSAVIETLQPEVREFDPMVALDGGANGLDAYREIISLAADDMKPGAHLVFEIGYDQKRAVSDLLFKAGFTDLRHQQDLGGNDRAIAATKT